MSTTSASNTIKQSSIIYSMNGFKDENPVTSENFDSIIDEYELDNEDVHCCLINKYGSLCHKEHKHGYIARLKDQTLSIIGNVCVISLLDKDSAIRQSIARFRNTRKAQANLTNLYELMAKDVEIRTKLTSLKKTINEIETKATLIGWDIGEVNLRRLCDLVGSNGKLKIRAGFLIKGLTPEENQKEKDFVTYDLDTIKGISIFNFGAYSVLQSRIQKIERSLLVAKGIIEAAEGGANPNTVKANECVVAIRDIEKVTRDVDALKSASIAFESNQMSLLCYLSTNKGERYKAAKYVLSLPGYKDLGLDKKGLINQFDNRLKESFKADAITVLDH